MRVFLALAYSIFLFYSGLVRLVAIWPRNKNGLVAISVSWPYGHETYNRFFKCTAGDHMAMNRTFAFFNVRFMAISNFYQKNFQLGLNFKISLGVLFKELDE